MGKILVIKNADFSQVAVAHVTPSGGPIISITNEGVVTISDQAAIAIYYTTNGTTPTVNSTQYNTAFSVITGTTVKAISEYADGSISDVRSKTRGTVPTEPLTITDFTAYSSTEHTGFIDTNNEWNSTVNYKHLLIPISGYASLKINNLAINMTYGSETAHTEAGAFSTFAFLSDVPDYIDGPIPELIGGQRIKVIVGASLDQAIPSNAKYLYVYIGYWKNGVFDVSYLPTQITLDVE